MTKNRLDIIEVDILERKTEMILLTLALAKALTSKKSLIHIPDYINVCNWIGPLERGLNKFKLSFVNCYSNNLFCLYVIKI